MILSCRSRGRPAWALVYMHANYTQAQPNQRPLTLRGAVKMPRLGREEIFLEFETWVPVKRSAEDRLQP
jgi:hypothetical protein